MRKAFGIRNKLIGIFILIKVLPLIVLAWFAWHQVYQLTEKVRTNFLEVADQNRSMAQQVADLATQNSIEALDIKSREAIEHLTTDTARDVAAFLYDRDGDIKLAALLEPNEEAYREFLSTRHRPVVEHDSMVLDASGDKWIFTGSDSEVLQSVEARNPDNSKDFHYRPREAVGRRVDRPLYLEMSFVDLSGRETVKITTSEALSGKLKDISNKGNTYCRAETYYSELGGLAPGEIYVSDVIGAFVATHMIGTYTKDRAEELGIAFAPEESAYAGRENPVGRRFQGIIRWVTPVVRKERIIGFVTLALDHTHVMEFTDHIVPTEERYSAISDAGSGNYAFMWDYKDRNISHPRDYFIVGYDPNTGSQDNAWLEQGHYDQWRDSGLPFGDFVKTLSTFVEPSLSKKPAKELVQAGKVGLDGRYLNFAPQCEGWHNITQYGGSGSFLIYWSGLWKLTTAASIPYHTGQYSHHPRGFGYVTIGANVHEFHRPAMETAERITTIEENHIRSLDDQSLRNQTFLMEAIGQTARELTSYTGAMVVIVIIIAIWMASTLTGRITQMIKGIDRFQKGDMNHRLGVRSGDELDELSNTFNTMADNIQQSITDIQISKKASEEANRLLMDEIHERQTAQSELARHRDHLEDLVSERTQELQREINERKQAEETKFELEKRLHRAEKMEAIGTLAGGVAHDLNNILTGIVSYPDLLLQRIPEDSTLRKPLQTIRLSGNKAAAIVQDLLTLARRSVAETAVLDLNKLLSGYIDSPEHRQLMSHQKGVDLHISLAEDLMPIRGSEVHLFKTIMNLVSNAVEAMPEGGRLSLRTQNQYVDRPFGRYDHVEEGDYVTLVVQDTGIGIPREDIGRVFEPFYTKKKMGRSGTGLGMAVVWGAIRDHKGYIDCRSRENQGTEFIVYIPVCREPLESGPIQQEMDDLNGNGEKILIVDDVLEQREIASLILSEMNYSVHSVSSGEEAVAYMEANTVDLVVLDMIMDPGMDGLDTYRQIIQQHPGQKAIITSGFSETERIREAQRLGVGPYLKKPYSIENLGKAVKIELGRNK